MIIFPIWTYSYDNVNSTIVSLKVPSQATYQLFQTPTCIQMLKWTQDSVYSTAHTLSPGRYSTAHTTEFYLCLLMRSPAKRKT